MRISNLSSPALRGVGQVSPAVSVFSPVLAFLAKEKKKALGLDGLGQSTTQPPTMPKGVQIAVTAVAMVSMGASVYHGYKRNNSVGWAVWWGLMGAMFPIITPVIAVAQGYAKPAQKT